MRPLSYTRARTVDEAVAVVAGDPSSAFLAGGTTQVDLVRLGVAQPDLLVDINELPLTGIVDLPGGGLQIGALARMSDVARAPSVRERYPAVSESLLLSASARR
jgi:xanthine dehydrogenase YagS FAD-binding subunit